MTSFPNESNKGIKKPTVKEKKAKFYFVKNVPHNDEANLQLSRHQKVQTLTLIKL